ncbi:group I truncated hemoglobin [Microcella frigidaquae]|uniref:Hemoglobin n=1 Tax=Microcella frigidaquae TaxID=424758 RepID=A0A840XH75_9MICO|nr:group 1 truncated hemoglobin [Microcella frigidaquae]MBB5617852.1 hemoglobin [Microcella frigidaquae]NHN45825.1 group 1 truncated hemoglobin [Microcella frigidaquae]
MLFDQLGGSAGLDRLAAALADRLDADPALAPLFARVDRDRLRRQHAHYLAAVLGGPEVYDGRGLREAHRPLRIDDELFDRFLAHVVESARDTGANAVAVDELAGLVRGLRPAIVNRGLG